MATVNYWVVECDDCVDGIYQSTVLGEPNATRREAENAAIQAGWFTCDRGGWICPTCQREQKGELD